MEGRGRLLLVQKTGWGKSNVYFIATKLLRENGFGTTLLVSPLLALMRNQILQAERIGVRAVTINSDNQDEWEEVEAAIRENKVDILLISPERFANEHFRTEVLSGIAANIGLLVIDEAHCISDWGHDFRPHYRLIQRIIQMLPANLRLLATTATANDRVVADLQDVLGPNLTISRGDLNRPSLKLQTIRLPKHSQRLAWLSTHVPKLPGNGIIYTLTVKDANRVANWLKSQGLAVESYTGETGDRREELENALLENKVKALVATTALGMGFDKPDLGFVIHYQSPSSVIAYYQQVGRAGRGLDAAYGILLSGEEETEIADYFIESAFPTQDEVRQVIGALQHVSSGLSIPELLNRLNITFGRIEKTLALLSLESPAPIAKQGSKWQLTSSTLSDEFWERTRRLTALRHAEQLQMQQYVGLSSGHMEFLIRALDGDPSNIHPPNIPDLPVAPTKSLVTAAEGFLHRTSIPIVPREKWPTGGLPLMHQSGSISPEHRAQEGRALCLWGDPVWGELVREGKYTQKHFADELVDACTALIRDWNPQPFPTWVTCTPSWNHLELVPDFSRRLAASLDLPFHGVIQKIADRPSQKTMVNSSQQARNVDGSIAIIEETIPDGPVLLIDDMVDSRWTFTVAAWLLRSHGSGEVFPLALANTGHNE